MTQLAKSARRAAWPPLLVSLLIVILGLVSIRWHPREQRRIRRHSQLMRQQDNRLRPHNPNGFLTWDVVETDLINGVTRFEGAVRWNEKSGAPDQPVKGMPVVLYLANPARQTLTPIASTRTDAGGQFVIETPCRGQPVLLGGRIHHAVDIPAKVRAVLESPRRAAPRWVQPF